MNEAPVSGAWLVGPVAGLAISLLFNWLFYTGRIMPRNTVPREDHEALKAVTASYATGFPTLTNALNDLVATVKLLPRRRR